MLKGCGRFLVCFFLRTKCYFLRKFEIFKLYFKYIFDYIKFKNQSKNNIRFKLSWLNRFPILNEKTNNTAFSREYVYHIAWAARILKSTRPELHIDISSSINFIAVASAFIPIDFYDYRPAKLELNNVKVKHGDLMNLPFEDQSIKSLSCMHVVEHIGLGRYGEPIDYDGDLTAISELKRVLKKDGNLLFVVPWGKPQIQFNAHRIYSYDQIMSYFSDLKLKEFALIPQDFKDGGLVYNPSKKLLNKQQIGACGCFLFVR